MAYHVPPSASYLLNTLNHCTIVFIDPDHTIPDLDRTLSVRVVRCFLGRKRTIDIHMFNVVRLPFELEHPHWDVRIAQMSFIKVEDAFSSFDLLLHGFAPRFHLTLILYMGLLLLDFIEPDNCLFASSSDKAGPLRLGQ